MGKQKSKTVATFRACLIQFFKAYDFSLQIVLGVSLGCAAFLLDYFDIPSQIIINTPGGVLWPIVCALAILLVVWLLDLHVFDLFAITSENALDVAAMVSVLASIFYVPARIIVLGKCIYTQISTGVAIAALLVIAIRLVIRHRKQKKSDAEDGNLIDLKDLYEGVFSREGNNPVLLREKDIDYDLLNRDGIIDKLYRSIPTIRAHWSALGAKVVSTIPQGATISCCTKAAKSTPAVTSTIRPSTSNATLPL